MRFKDASKIHIAVESMRLANYPVARNRAKVNDVFNGNPPWSEEERVKNKIFNNANPLYGTRIAHSASQSLDNAILKPGNFFDVRLDMGPQHKRMEWGHIITKEVNRILRKQQAYTDMWKDTNKQVVLHGLGPVWWRGRENPIPKCIGIEDVLVPAQTLLSFENLEFFAVYRQWTYAELWDMTKARGEVDPGWNMPLVDKLLESLAEQPLQSTVMGQRWLFPEKLAEDLKENAGLFMTSACPTIFIWDFYFRDYDEDSDNQCWERRIVLDYMQLQPEALRSAISTDAKTQFLYEQKGGTYADDVEQIIHWQIGNCSPVAPSRYYSVRSLGFLLFAVLQVQNRLYNRFADSTFANLLELFRNVGEDDRERLEKVDLWHMGIVPDGLSFVTAAERHEINQPQVEMMMAMNKQLMGESSSTWMPEVDTGTDKEQTLGEARIRLQTSASLSNALLSQHYNRATFLYRESCRRFCLKGSKNRLVKEFQKRVQMQGVPLEMLDVEHWEVEPDRILGGGNKALEGLAVDKLMAAKGAFDPDSQRKILWMATLAWTDNAEDADELVPPQKPVSQSMQLASSMMGTLMDALPVTPAPGFNEPDYIGTLLALAGQALQAVEASEQVPQSLPVRMQKIAGLHTVLEHIQGHLQVLEGDQSNVQIVKQFGKQLQQDQATLDKLTQHVAQELDKSQQGQEADSKQAETQAKIQAMMMQAQAEVARGDADHAQKQEHKDAAWKAENERKNAMTAADIERQRALTATELQHTEAQHHVDVATQLAKTKADIAAKDLTTAAEIRRPKPAPASNGKK